MLKSLRLSTEETTQDVVDEFFLWTTESHRREWVIDDCFDGHRLMLSIRKVCRSLNVIDPFSLFKTRICLVDNIFCYNLLSTTR